MRNQLNCLSKHIVRWLSGTFNHQHQHDQYQSSQPLLPPQKLELDLDHQRTDLRFRSAVENAPVLIWMSDLEAQCTYFNQTWLAFTGRSLEQELGNGWVEGIHPDDCQHCVNTYLSAFHDRQPFTIEYRLRLATGEYGWVLNNGTPQFGENHEFIGYVGTCVDITDLKQATLQATARLEEANLYRSRYEAAGRASHQLLYDYDFKTNSIWIENSLNILGYTATEFGSHSLEFWLSVVHPDDRPHFHASIQRAIIENISSQQVEYRIKHKDGHYIWVQDSNEILLNEERLS